MASGVIYICTRLWWASGLYGNGLTQTSLCTQEKNCSKWVKLETSGRNFFVSSDDAHAPLPSLHRHPDLLYSTTFPFQKFFQLEP